MTPIFQGVAVHGGFLWIGLGMVIAKALGHPSVPRFGPSMRL
jgi:hypothetical protein